MNEAPPKVLKDAVSLAKTGHGSLTHGSAAALTRIPISKENLPVLAAFQEFLEMERRRTRNNVIALSLFFSFVLFGCILSAYFIGNALIRQMKTDLRGLESDVRLTRTDTITTLDSIKRESESINRQITSQNEKITVELNKGLSGQMTEISSVKEATDNLQKENEAIKEDVAKMRLALAAIVNPASPQATEAGIKAAEAAVPGFKDAYARARIIRYSITLPDSKKTVNWLTPVILE